MLYNTQVLDPGEAVGMTRKETGGGLLPFKIHAVVGDESNLPTKRQSLNNLLAAAVVPTAFIVGTLAAASTAGTMTGPSAALSRVASGLVVKGMVIDSAALAAGSLTANRAAAVADKLIKKHPRNFSTTSGLLRPGQKFVVVRGGVESPLEFEYLKSERHFRYEVPLSSNQVKSPMETLQDKVDFYTAPSRKLLLSLSRISKIENGEDCRDTMTETSSTQSIQSVPTTESSVVGEDLSKHAHITQPRCGSRNDDYEDIADPETKENGVEVKLRHPVRESLQLEEQRKQEETDYIKSLQFDNRLHAQLF